MQALSDRVLDHLRHDVESSRHLNYTRRTIGDRKQRVADEFKYKAFISYSHSDEKWATWLHRSLETYKVPKAIVGSETPMGKIPARLAPVFRDRDELPSATNLGEMLTQSLTDAGTQIVICSPAAAKSHWVNEEILTYKRLGRSNRIFCLIVDGEPWASNKPGQEDQECFPPALRCDIGENGELSDVPAEPIAADARPVGDGKANARLKLISGMLGVGFDALKQREQLRRQQRMVAITTAAFVGMAITSGLAFTAYLARIEAEEQRNRAEAEAETAKQTTQFMVGLFSVSDPSESLGNTITAREILDKGAARIDEELADQPAIQTTLMDTMGTVYTSLGLYTPAAALLESALKKRQDLYGAENLEVASSLSRYGEVLTLKADYEQAEKMYRDALAISIAQLGEEDLEVARIQTELADLLSRMGEYQSGEVLIRDALATRRKLLGNNSVEVAESLEVLALNLYEQGNYDDPVGMLREAVALRREIHGGPHPDLAEALNNLGLVLAAVGDYDEAVALYREALDMKRFLLGDSHPEIAMGLNNVAFALHDQGKYEEAERMYREAIDMQRKLLGDDHPEVALSLNNLAFLLYDKNERDAAIAMSRASLEMYRRTVGDENPAVARGMANLAMWLIESGDYASAELLARESLALRKKLLGDEHTAVAASMTLVANTLIATGRYEEALQLAVEARKIYTAALTETHWRTAVAISAEGAALAGLQRYEEAESRLLQSYELLSNDPGALSMFETDTAKRLAALYSNWNKPDEAARYLAVLASGEGP